MKARLERLATLLFTLLVLATWEVDRASAALSAAQCKEERRIGLNACKPVVYGKLPSPECCERVRVSHVECVWPVVTPKLATPKLAALIDLNRAIRLIQGCGRRVPRHTSSVAVSRLHESRTCFAAAA